MGDDRVVRVRAVTLRMPEGTYQGRGVQRRTADGGTLIDIVMRAGVPFRDDDAVYGFYCGGPAMTIAKGVALLRRDIMRDRKRYMGAGWCPDRKQMERAARAGQRGFLREAE